jgi:hypothetical protein
LKAIVRVEAEDVGRRLEELGFANKESLLEVVRACVAAQGGCTDNDPPGAPGYESWRFGVRRAREIYRPLGWEKDDAGGYSTIVNRANRIRMAILNSTDGAGMLDGIPQNRSKKGACSERAAVTNAQFVLPGSEVWDVPDARFEDFATWHLCVYISGDDVRAELSLLNDFEAGYFTGVHEKIILVGDGDWKKINFKDDDDTGPEIDVTIRRK